MSFKLKKRTEGAWAVLQVEGEIVGPGAVKINARLESMRKSHEGGVVVDLSAVSFIDSHGLGVLIYNWKLAENAGRKMAFVAPAGVVRDMLTSTHLDKIMTIAESIEAL